MKLSSVLCASFVALVALALAADGAQATFDSDLAAPGCSSMFGSLKTNVYKLDNNDASAAKDCTDDGGKVSMDYGGKKVCKKLPGRTNSGTRPLACENCNSSDRCTNANCSWNGSRCSAP